MRSVLTSCMAALAFPGAATGQPPDGFYVRQGYEVSVAVPDLDGARFMEFDDRGRLCVSRPAAGEIDIFSPNGDSWTPAGAFVKGRARVHGLHFYDGWMWFATDTSVHRARDTNGDGAADDVVDVLTGLPGEGHWWRPIFVTPEGFYTSIGDTGNITDERKTDRQKMWLYALDGKSRRLFASGIRNNEKYRYRPGTTEIWGFDHGSDWFGRNVGDRDRGPKPVTDLNPPDELNLYVDGGFYGHPFIVGSRLPRYEFMDRDDINDLAANTIPPEWPVGAHWACNGWTFIDPEINRRTQALPAELEGDILVAAHGSWNSSRKVGYCITRVLFDKDPGSDRAGRPYGLEKIVSCLDKRGETARPVDCVQAPDGSVLFSSDAPGRIYRLRHVGGK